MNPAITRRQHWNAFESLPADLRDIKARLAVIMDAQNPMNPAQFDHDPHQRPIEGCDEEPCLGYGDRSPPKYGVRIFGVE